MPKINIKNIDNSAPLNILKKNLKFLMAKDKVGTLELSRLTGVSAATIKRFRTGTGNPNLKTLIELAQFFGVKISELIESDLSE